MGTLEKVIAFMASKSYAMFTENPYDLNIVGIRGEFVPDKFGCQLLVFYANEEKRLIHHIFPVTTYPGVYWIDNPMQAAGCGVLLEGQYRGAWNLGFHHQINALVQNWQTSPKQSPLSWTRIQKGTRVITREMLQMGKRESGFAGFNLHPVMDQNNQTVGQDSAGCQVTQYRADFDLIMSIAKKQVANGLGDRYTYTLIHNNDLV